jgi:hypothetical protein
VQTFWGNTEWEQFAVRCHDDVGGGGRRKKEGAIESRGRREGLTGGRRRREMYAHKYMLKSLCNVRRGRGCVV